MSKLRLIILFVLFIIFGLSCRLVWLLHQHEVSSGSPQQKENLKKTLWISKYSIKFYEEWSKLFLQQDQGDEESKEFKKERRQIGLKLAPENKGILLDEGRYLISSEQTQSDSIQNEIHLIKSSEIIASAARRNMSNIEHGQEYKNEPLLDHVLLGYDSFNEIYVQQESAITAVTVQTATTKNSSKSQPLPISLKYCLTLPNRPIEYFTDSQNKLWIVSSPNNNIILIQIYDCVNEKKVIQKIVHQPSTESINEQQDKQHNDQRLQRQSIMINKVVSIREILIGTNGTTDRSAKTIEIQCLTYQANKYFIKIEKTQQQQKHQKYSIIQEKLNRTHSIISQIKVFLDEDSSINSHNDQAIQADNQTDSNHKLNLNKIKYRFIDPTFALLNQQIQNIVFKVAKAFVQQTKPIIQQLNVKMNWVVSMLNQKIKQTTPKTADDAEYLDIDISVMDMENNYVLNLKYDHQKYANDEEEKDGRKQGTMRQSSLMKLDRFLLNTRVPIFHSNAEYNKLDMVDLLNRITQATQSKNKDQKPQLYEFKRLQIQNAWQKPYHTDHHLSVYPFQPSDRLYHIGIGQKMLSFYPNSNVKPEQYYHIRTNKGGVILQGSKIKGAYQNQPYNQIDPLSQTQQIVSSKPEQILATVFQAHIAYKMLYTTLKGNGKRIQLINGMSGNIMLTHYINTKQGYHYAGGYLFNNQWWIIQHSYQLKSSYLVKYQLFVNTETQKTINSVKRQYGRSLSSGDFDSIEQDDLSILLNKFNDKYDQVGYVILNIYRCIDQFYYIEYTDTEGRHYAVARIHFKRLSNRQYKANGKYSGVFEQSLLVHSKDMIKQKQRIQPYGIVLQQLNLFNHIHELAKESKTYQWRTNGHMLSNYTLRNIERFSVLEKLQHFQHVLPYSVYSVHGGEPMDKKLQYGRKRKNMYQDIWMINMRTVIENIKLKAQLQAMSQAKLKVDIISGFALFIIFMLTVKVLVTGLALDNERKQKEEKKAVNEKENEVQKDQVSTSKKGGKKGKKDKAL